MPSRSIVSFFLASALVMGCPTRNNPDTGGGTDTPRADTPVECTSGPENTAAACSDGCSNDGDTFTDCDDFDCDAFCADGGMPRDAAGSACDAAMTAEDTLAACTDGCSNDGDTFVDCADFDCDAFCTDGGPGPTVFTIRQLQDRADAMHPAPGTRVTVNQAGMVALTPRVVVGSATGGTSMTCRFAVWVGAAVSGEFTAIQVQELIDLPTGTTSCFDLPAGRISDAFAPGDAVVAITDATYNEFCAGPMPLPMPCTDYEQSNIFLGGTATITRGAPGTAPSGTVVPVSDLVGASGAPGARAVALEGGLFTVSGARISSRPDGAFTIYSAFAAGTPANALDIVVSNFPQTACVRTALMGLAGGTGTTNITGVLLPNFGRWSLRIRNESDVTGVTCP